jgi:hypothetical protein
MTDELLTILGNEESYFRESYHNLSGTIQIDPKAKLLITLNMLGFGDHVSHSSTSFRWGSEPQWT